MTTFVICISRHHNIVVPTLNILLGEFRVKCNWRCDFFVSAGRSKCCWRQTRNYSLTTWCSRAREIGQYRLIQAKLTSAHWKVNKIKIAWRMLYCIWIKQIRIGGRGVGLSCLYYIGVPERKIYTWKIIVRFIVYE